MILKPGDTYYGEFTTSDPQTGASRDADSLPTATATKNGVDDAAFVLTATKLSTGRYSVTGTVPSGYTAGTTVCISVAATVNSVAAGGVIDSISVETWRLSDIPGQVWAATGRTLSSFGFSITLAANGLDNIPITDPGGVANHTLFPRLIVALYRLAYKKSALAKTGPGQASLTTFSDTNTVNTTQTLTDDGTTQTKGAAT